MLDVAIRVESIRPFVVTQMAILLDNIHVFTTSNGAANKNASDICEVLYAATWICGEFAEHLREPNRTLDSMLKSKVTNLPGHIQSAFVQNIFKLYSHLVTKIYSGEENEANLSEAEVAECKQLTDFVFEKIQIFEQSADIEVQERASSMLQVLKFVQKIFEKYLNGEGGSVPRVDLELAALFDGELNPVAPKAQKKVPIPEGLDLDAWINEPPSDSDESEEQASNLENQIFLKTTSSSGQQSKAFTALSSAAVGGSSNYGGNDSTIGGYSKTNVGAKKMQPELSEDDLAKYRETRKMQLDSNPFYIKSGPVKVLYSYYFDH